MPSTHHISDLPSFQWPTQYYGCIPLYYIHCLHCTARTAGSYMPMRRAHSIQSIDLLSTCKEASMLCIHKLTHSPQGGPPSSTWSGKQA